MSLTQAIMLAIKQYSGANESGTPDFILAKYLVACLDAYNEAVKDRDQWYVDDEEGQRRLNEESDK